MLNEHKRIKELADGWRGSETYVSLSAADALVLKGLGAAVEPGTHEAGPSRIRAADLVAAADAVPADGDAADTPDGGEGTPNQRSVGTPTAFGVRPANGPQPPDPGTVNLDPESKSSAPAGPTATATTEPGDIDGLTVAELRELADREGHDLAGATHKADVLKAVKAGRRKAARGK